MQRGTPLQVSATSLVGQCPPTGLAPGGLWQVEVPSCREIRPGVVGVACASTVGSPGEKMQGFHLMTRPQVNKVKLYTSQHWMSRSRDAGARECLLWFPTGSRM